MHIVAIRVFLLIAFLAFWEFASGRLIQELFVSRPSKIAKVLWSWIVDGSVFFHAGITATEAFAGFAAGAAAGILVGLALGRSVRVAQVLNPFIMSFYSLPKLALAPLFILWFGIGMTMKIALTAMIVFFLVFLNTYTGVRNVSRELVSILRLMGAQERHILTKVVIPSALSWVFAGLRVSAPYALIGAVVGELIASNRGLGHLLSYSASQFDTAGVFAALIGIVALAALLNSTLDFVSARAMPWKGIESDREMAI